MSVQESTSFVSLALPPGGRGALWTPLVGGPPAFTGRKKVWPYAPEGMQNQSQLRAGHARPRGRLPHRGSLVGPCVAATGCHQALCGVQKEGAEQKYVLGSCPSQRRSSLQVGKPRGHMAAATCLLWEWGQATAWAAGTLIRVPAKDSQSPALSMALCPQFLELDGPEFKSYAPACKLYDPRKVTFPF